MSFLEELEQKTPLSDVLGAGVDSIRYQQEITFTPYVRLVLPLDGFVFWVRYDQVGTLILRGVDLTPGEEASFTVPCSLHMATDTEQSEDENLDVSNVVVTVKQEVRPFHDTLVTVMWLAEFQGVRFAINSRKSFYRQSNVYHYIGKTIYPAMLTQIIDDASLFDATALILSNSTPLWLALASIVPDAVWLPGYTIPLFPKFLLPDNLEPAYGVILPVEGSQRAVNLAPTYQPNFSRDQYVTEDVDIILYGCNNKVASDFLDTVLGLCVGEVSGFGINNSPVLQDESRQQSELSVLAQKKRIRFRINYHQTQLRALAIRYILKCVPTITVEI